MSSEDLKVLVSVIGFPIIIGICELLIFMLIDSDLGERKERLATLLVPLFTPMLLLLSPIFGENFPFFWLFLLFLAFVELFGSMEIDARTPSLERGQTLHFMLTGFNILASQGFIIVFSIYWIPIPY